MGKIRIKISSKPGKSGTKLAEGRVRVTRASGRGKPIFQNKAQLTVKVETTQNGENRS